MSTCPECGQKLERREQQRYRYVESGLPDVVLTGVTVYSCRSCKSSFPELWNLEALHNQIADVLVKKQFPLTGAEFRFLRKQMRMRAKDLAAILGVTPITVSRWETGKENIGQANDRLIRLLYLLHQIRQQRFVDPLTAAGQAPRQLQLIRRRRKWRRGTRITIPIPS